LLAAKKKKLLRLHLLPWLRLHLHLLPQLRLLLKLPLLLLLQPLLLNNCSAIISSKATLGWPFYWCAQQASIRSSAGSALEN
jgi:hypothetical protein